MGYKHYVPKKQVGGNVMKTYVSDVITPDILNGLTCGVNYIISSEMNSGKNYWVRNVLLPYADKNNKKTLILSHRTQTLKQQINYLAEYKCEQLRKFRGGMFDVKSYQAFQNMIKRDDPEIKSYDYIVCDEAHYFVSDSSFNTKTELSFNLLNNNNKAIKIFMTATPEGLDYLPWINKLEVLHEANYYNNQVKEMYRYEQNETVEAIVQNEVEIGNKVLIYHNSKYTIEDFNVGNSKSLHSGNRQNSLEFKQISETCQFECDVLNTTKLMTEATEIKDKLVQTIVIHGISDIDTFVQATGRVRNQKVNVYYKRISKRSIQARLRYLEKQLYYYDEFERLGEAEFIKEYGLDVIHKSMKAFYLSTEIHPDTNHKYTQLKVHQTGLAYLFYQVDMYEYMDEFGLERFFEKYFPNIYFFDLEQLKREELIHLDIIENYIDKKIFKQQQQELITTICNKYKLRSKNGSTKIGMKTINAFFEENYIPYVLENKKETRGDNRNKMYWVLKESY